MITDYEKLLNELKKAIGDCQECLTEFTRIFGWYTHYGQRPVSFAKFFKDYGAWNEQVAQIHYATNNENSIEEQLNTYQDVYNEGLKLFDRASNALYEKEITNAFKDGGVKFYAQCGKFEMETKTIAKTVNKLNQSYLPNENEAKNK